LTDLNLYECSLEGSPLEIGNLQSLKELNCHECTSLKKNSGGSFMIIIAVVVVIVGIAYTQLL